MGNTKILTNLDSVAEMIGAYVGMAEKIDEDNYTELLIKQAHGKAASAFDLDTAATARAGYLDHAYEYGVPGITKGKVKFPDPTAPEARLWVHYLNGHGGNQKIEYYWRPAKERTPPPTTASTGVPSKYLRKLSKRKYIWYNKAYTMEEGDSVTISPKRGRFLFIPFGPDNKNPKYPRNYIMYNGSVTVQPGRESKGTFSAHWLRWWGESGSAIITEEMEKGVTEDIRIAEAEIAARVHRPVLKPVEMTRVTSTTTSASRWMKGMFGRRRKVGKIV